MAESPEEFVARALDADGEGGRLAMPPVDEWPTFPFEGDIRVRRFLTADATEEPRHGEGGENCWRCDHELESAIWSDDSWMVTSLGRPSGLPMVVILFPRAHYDIDDMPEELGRALGPMLLRVEAAVRSVGEIGRVHVCRWGDGSAHFHWWFMARPARVPQLVGSFAAIWDDILPPIWNANLIAVARALTAAGGVAHI